MVHTLSELVGVPSATEPADLAAVAERRCQVLFDCAAAGDERAHDELIALHATYLAWAYVKQAGPLPAGTDSSGRGPVSR